MKVFLLLIAFCSIALANHDWDGYHWDSSNLNLLVEDQTTSDLYDVNDVVNDWNNLGTPVQMSLTTSDPNIQVSEAFSPHWLGLARIFIDSGHITQGEVKLNTRLLSKYYGLPEAKHVLCQELGHVLGLDHNRDGPDDGTPDDTCMNDVGHLGEYPLPNGHDAETLNELYNHTDGTTPTEPPPDSEPTPCQKNPNHPLCTGQSGWYTVHVAWYDPGDYGVYPDEVIDEPDESNLASILRPQNLLIIFVTVFGYLL